MALSSFVLAVVDSSAHLVSFSVGSVVFGSEFSRPSVPAGSAVRSFAVLIISFRLAALFASIFSANRAHSFLVFSGFKGNSPIGAFHVSGV